MATETYAKYSIEPDPLIVVNLGTEPHQRLWEMGRAETEQTCKWDVTGGELRALENFLRSMMAFEPAERPTADQLPKSEYMVKWALPAWERQKRQKKLENAKPVDGEH